jgi:hypothetical protein
LLELIAFQHETLVHSDVPDAHLLLRNLALPAFAAFLAIGGVDTEELE